MMKAITRDRYGSPDVLKLKDIDKPVIGDDDVLVRIRAASTNPYDWHFMRGKPYFMRLMSGLLKPKGNGLGADLAGQVEAVGKNVTRFRPGDEVYGEVDGGVPGKHELEIASFAEYVRVSEDSVVPKPTNLTYEQAAAVPMAGLTALCALCDYKQIEHGRKVLVNGASGGVGTFAVQIAKALGAEVTGVCSSRNVDMVESIGADHVIDYTREDFSRGGQKYDLMLDNVGNHSLSACRRVLSPDAVYLASFGQPDNLWFGPLAYLFRMSVLSLFVSQKLIPLSMKRTTENLLTLKDLIESEKVTPVIDRIYPLSETSEAVRYLEEGRAQGKVVISM
jgi:NADPH:quinone reductase-like Zn-dependent oxidoreductase